MSIVFVNYSIEHDDGLLELIAAVEEIETENTDHNSSAYTATASTSNQAAPYHQHPANNTVYTAAGSAYQPQNQQVYTASSYQHQNQSTPALYHKSPPTPRQYTYSARNQQNLFTVQNQFSPARPYTAERVCCVGLFSKPQTGRYRMMGLPSSVQTNRSMSQATFKVLLTLTPKMCKDNS